MAMMERSEYAAKAQYEAVTGQPWEDAPKRSARLCRQDSAGIAAALDDYDAAHGLDPASAWEQGLRHALAWLGLKHYGDVMTKDNPHRKADK